MLRYPAHGRDSKWVPPELRQMSLLCQPALCTKFKFYWGTFHVGESSNSGMTWLPLVELGAFMYQNCVSTEIDMEGHGIEAVCNFLPRGIWRHGKLNCTIVVRHQDQNNSTYMDREMNSNSRIQFLTL